LLLVLSNRLVCWQLQLRQLLPQQLQLHLLWLLLLLLLLLHLKAWRPSPLCATCCLLCGPLLLLLLLLDCLTHRQGLDCSILLCCSQHVNIIAVTVTAYCS
jgi:hypothetical protein